MTAAPIAPDALEPALRPFGRGTMLPADGIGMAAISHGRVVLVQVPEQWTAPLLDERGQFVLDAEGQVLLK